MYVFVRKDLSHPQQVVRACHAVSESTRFYPPPDGVIPNLVVIGINDESRLVKTASKLDKIGIRYKTFIEPDRDDEATAIATEPIFDDARHHFKNYTLLGSGGVVSSSYHLQGEERSILYEGGNRVG